jgi:PUB domain
MTKEEKLAKARALQDEARKRRAAEEKRIAEEQEKNRIRIAKELTEAKRKMDEQQQKLALEFQRKEKMEFENAKKAMLEQLKRDKMERFGGAAVANTGAGVAEAPKPKFPQGMELVSHGIKTVRTIYTEDRQPGVAKTAFKTCHTILSNALKDPTEEKFKKINLSNENF